MKTYFKIKEMLITETGIDNIIPSEDQPRVYANLTRLIDVLNVIRALLGCPITVTSGYRNKAVNAAVNGAPMSYHMVGRAADITCRDVPKLWDFCTTLYKQCIFVECIYYPEKNIIHVAI